MILEPPLTVLLEQLERFPAVLSEDAGRAAKLMAERLSFEQVERWALIGVAMATSSHRSWEAARAYFNATPPVLGALGYDGLMRWTALGERLCASSPTMASSYFAVRLDSSEAGLFGRLELLVELARQLHRKNLGGESLLAEVMRRSVELLDLLPGDLSSLGDFLSAIGRFAERDSRACLSDTLRFLPTLYPAQRPLFLAIVGSAALYGWGTASAFLEAASQRLPYEPTYRTGSFLELVGHVCSSSPKDALALLRDCWAPLAKLSDVHQDEVVGLAAELAPLSSAGAVAFVTSAPVLLQSLGVDKLKLWTARGVRLLQDNQEAGLSFLKLESRGSAELVEQLSPGVGLSAVQQVLATYCQALTGAPVRVHSVAELADRGIGWTSSARATTEGRDVYLPPLVSLFPTREENFSYYKVLASHQAGHLEFGTFSFEMDRPSTRFVDLRASRAPRAGCDRCANTPFEAFFDLFPRRRLAKDLFCIVEDARVDGHLMHRYAGLAQDYARVRRSALAARDSRGWRLDRSSCVEAALRLSLGASASTFSSTPLEGFARKAESLLEGAQGGRGTVEDSAETTIRLYALVEETVGHRIPGAPVRRESSEMGDVAAFSLPQDIDDLSAHGTDAAPSVGADDELYQGMDAVDYRGELKPELIQALMKLRGEARPGEGADAPMDAEVLRALLEKGLEVEIGDLVLGDLSTSSPLLVTNLLNECPNGRPEDWAKKTSPDLSSSLAANAPVVLSREPRIEVREYRYDEWDFRAEDYRRDWCVLKERVLPGGSPEYYAATLTEHADLVNEVRRQFERLRPESYERRRNLDTGDELDLNAAVESMVDRRARLTPSEKLYWRREKLRRDVSVAVLLDMSASTGDELKDPTAEAFWREQVFETWEDELRAWQEWCSRERRKRIIDLEKESVVLLVEALEIVRDTYGIYGFSGYGRDNAEFFVVKELEERCDERVRSRIASIDAQRGTRMGPAVRHVASKLAGQESRVKLLLLLSDGYPQDHDYGRDRTEREYALHDTRMALLEARRRDIVPFCVTVDQTGHDYLKLMCPDMGYVVVSDLETLPRRLPALYRSLTAR